jgi:hypothetical protein
MAYHSQTPSFDGNSRSFSRPVLSGYWAIGAAAASMPELRPGFFTFRGYLPVIGMGMRIGGDGDLGLSEQSERQAKWRDGTGPCGATHARGRRAFACAGLLAALGAALALAGCGAINDETAGRAMMTPGRYDIYPCPNIEARIIDIQKRRIELEQLMARSAQSPGGEFINAVAYRSEYLQTGGDLEELGRASAQKKCASDSKYTSKRTVY